LLDSLLQEGNRKFSMPDKTIQKVIENALVSEGRGAKVRRSIGVEGELRNLDPFLMLDEFLGQSTGESGFPDHPHRGFETVSYILKGEFYHEDCTGHHGQLKGGDVQWITTGRGIVHSELPGIGLTRGIMLWNNLPKAMKFMEPETQDLFAPNLPTAEQDGVKVKIIAGETMGVKSPAKTKNPTIYFDFKLEPGKSWRQPMPDGWTTLSYVLDGSCAYGEDGEAVDAHHTIIFNKEGDSVLMKNTGSEPNNVLLIAGRPIGEPIARRRFFVMNEEEELDQAFADYESSTNGFEKGKGWKSVQGTKLLEELAKKKAEEDGGLHKNC